MNVELLEYYDVDTGNMGIFLFIYILDIGDTDKFVRVCTGDGSVFTSRVCIFLSYTYYNNVVMVTFYHF